MTSSIGAFCLSVDGSPSDTLSTETTRRHRDVISMLDEMKIPSTWTMASTAVPLVAENAEISVTMPRAAAHAEIVRHLRNAKARILGQGGTFSTVVADPCQAKASWSVFVRQGVSVVRPYTAELLPANRPTVIRGGLMLMPITCSFVGGSRRTVKTLNRICQRKLAEAIRQGDVFHAHVDVSPTRDSWSEELDALKGLVQYAYHGKAKGLLNFVHLSKLPSLLYSRRGAKSTGSILRAA